VGRLDVPILAGDEQAGASQRSSGIYNGFLAVSKPMSVTKETVSGSQVATQISLMYVVTSQMSTLLLKGQPKFLRKAGFKVSVVFSPGLSFDAVEDEGVETYAVPMVREMGGFSNLVSLHRLWRLIQRHKPTITNVGTPKAGLLGGLAAYLSRVPCRFYSLWGLRCETTRGIKRWALILTERIACRCAHRVICASESLRQRAVALKIVDPRRTVVLASGSCNGVDLDRFAPTPERVRQAAELKKDLGIPAEAPVIGFVGRFTRDKGICELIEAYLLLRQKNARLYLLLVGDFEDGDPVPSNVRKLIQGDSQIVHTGMVRDTAPYYHTMDILALPTYREGFPTIVLEAHAAGKPVVAARATGVVDAVIDGVSGVLVPVGDSEALAKGLDLLLRDKGLAAALGSAGRDRVRREFKQERFWEALAQEYIRLLEARGIQVAQPDPSKAVSAPPRGPAIVRS
jgi:glycosyltransferase involved in cell wall biosynthesis